MELDFCTATKSRVDMKLMESLNKQLSLMKKSVSSKLYKNSQTTIFINF